MNRLFIILLTAGMCASCVSMNVHNAVKAEALRQQTELESARQRLARLTAENDRLSQSGERSQSEYELMEADYKALDEKYRRLLADGSAETSRILLELEQNQRELRERSERIEELERLVRAREEALVSIRRQVADAMLGFEGKGLSISTRDGKVYVSMEDKLLFRSGSYEVGQEGKTAVRELAAVLARNPDISIMVEGHTDDVPYRGSGNLSDNLDLSVKRATSVVRLLLGNEGITPSRIIAAGRGEWMPVVAAKTTEARARNRRTEIILTPKLDELMELLDRQ